MVKKWSKMVKMVQNGPSCPKWFKMVKMVKIVKNGQNGLKWSKIVLKF